MGRKWIYNYITGLLALCVLIFGCIKPAHAEGTITRAEWLSELTKVFEMTVEDDNYPDNYFSDLDPSSEYYYDMLLAVQFGLVDIEAGQPCYPEEAVTRDFAAHTLNFGLAFQLEEDATYSFSDVEDVLHPADAQVAVNRGWFALQDGKFQPEQPITNKEKERMLNDAEEVWHSTDIDQSHENVYEYTEDMENMNYQNP